MKLPSPGQWLQLIGTAHTALGAVACRAELGTIARQGVIRTVQDRGDTATAFWFVLAGPALWTAGRLLRSAEQADDLRAQRAAGAVLATVGAVGSAAMPASGFWAVAAAGVAAYRRGSVSSSSGGSHPNDPDPAS